MIIFIIYTLYKLPQSIILSHYQNNRVKVILNHFIVIILIQYIILQNLIQLNRSIKHFYISCLYFLKLIIQFWNFRLHGFLIILKIILTLQIFFCDFIIIFLNYVIFNHFFNSPFLN